MHRASEYFQVSYGGLFFVSYKTKREYTKTELIHILGGENYPSKILTGVTPYFIREKYRDSYRVDSLSTLRVKIFSGGYIPL